MYNESINLNLYKIFYDVAKYGSVSAASKNLMISQPAISRSIKNLESELNVELFHRTLNGMVLTEKGKELFGYVEEACNSLLVGQRCMSESANLTTGKLAIGVPTHIASCYLLDKLNAFHKAYPNIEVSIISRTTDKLIKLLENHEIDFMIDPSPVPYSEKELHIEPLFNCRHVFFQKKGLGVEAKNLKDLEKESLILPNERSSHRNKLNEILQDHNVKFKNVLSIETSEMIKELVQEGCGVGYILDKYIESSVKKGELEILPIEEELPELTINLIYIDKYLMIAPKKFIDEYILVNK
jgi:DNA-binding transcriptional LysR family regulator